MRNKISVLEVAAIRLRRIRLRFPSFRSNRAATSQWTQSLGGYSKARAKKPG
ncbi:MAG: hypothetical protein ACETVX_01610 [bacterium]